MQTDINFPKEIKINTTIFQVKTSVLPILKPFKPFKNSNILKLSSIASAISP